MSVNAADGDQPIESGTKHAAQGAAVSSLSQRECGLSVDARMDRYETAMQQVRGKMKLGTALSREAMNERLDINVFTYQPDDADQ